jgi:cation diffusion facilitator CzcD-associated flavoprotein CzcO
VWLSTTLKSGSWNEGEKLWTLSLDRSGEMRIITADHVVLAVGAGCQIPLMPQYPSQVWQHRPFPYWWNC